MSPPLRLVLLVPVLLLYLMLAACKSDVPPAACPATPLVDGFRTVTVEGGNMRLRLPGAVWPHYTLDCKQVRHFSVTYVWHEGKLTFRPSSATAYNLLVEVYPIFTSLDLARLDATKYRYVGPVLSHKTYPLDLNALVEQAHVPLRKSSQFAWKVWSVRGTHDPVTQRPFTANCDIRAVDRTRPETAVEGDFPHDYPDARCRGFVRALKDDKVISAGVHIWARNAPYIDQIYNAVAAELQSYILED